MAGPSLTTEVYILDKAPPKEAFQPMTAFCAEHGNLRILQRIPRKTNPAHVSLDLFDRAGVVLDSGAAGSWFIKEVRLENRPSGIGARYARLRHASGFTAVIARNPVHEESRRAVFDLLGRSLAAFSTADRPDVVEFKSVYCFARDEGYPLKEHWFPTLPREDRQDVITLLNRPVVEQTTPLSRVVHLQHRLAEYLRGHTDILID